MFYALNSSYYARWYYMPVLVLCAATAMTLQKANLCETEYRRALGLVALCTLSSIAFALVPNEKDGTTTIGVVEAALVGEVAHHLRNTPNVIGFLGGSDKPVPLRQSEVNRILGDRKSVV